MCPGAPRSVEGPTRGEIRKDKSQDTECSPITPFRQGRAIVLSGHRAPPPRARLLHPTGGNIGFAECLGRFQKFILTTPSSRYIPSSLLRPPFPKRFRNLSSSSSMADVQEHPASVAQTPPPSKPAKRRYGASCEVRLLTDRGGGHRSGPPPL